MHSWFLPGTHLYQSHSCLHSAKLFVNKLAASCCVPALMSWLLLVSIEIRCYLAVVQPLLCSATGREAGLRGRKDWSSSCRTELSRLSCSCIWVRFCMTACLPAIITILIHKEKGQELGSAGRVKGRSWFSGKGQSAFCRSVFGRLTGLTCFSHGCDTFTLCHYPGKHSGCNTHRIRSQSWTRDFFLSGCEWMMSRFSSAWLLESGLFRFTKCRLPFVTFSL